jgi:IS1 family transposase
MLGMNKLSRDKRVQIISQLVEGMSLRAITRTTGVSINTVTKLLVDAGKACSEYQDKHLRNLACRRLQLDEIWAFCYAKAANVKTAKTPPEGAGDVWTWVAIDADTKLIPSWFIGSRDHIDGRAFVEDLASRLTVRVQLTSDGHRPYLTAVPETFKGQIDYAMLVKHYAAPKPQIEAARRYSPVECTGISTQIVAGNPNPSYISTSYVERQNLTMRMSMRRFTRLTNAFSKKVENHTHAVALHFMHYNFCRIHTTLRCSPAMKAGVTPHLWDIVDVVRMVEEWEAAQEKRAARWVVARFRHYERPSRI